MSTPQRKFLVTPNLNGNGTRSLILAGIASIISIGAHAGLILLLINLDLGAAEGKDQGSESAPLVDDGTADKKKAEEKKKEEDKTDKDRGKEDYIDLTRIDIGNNTNNDTNYDVPKIGDFSAPPLSPDAPPDATPGSLDPNVTNITPMTIPPPPGVGNVFGKGGVLSSADGTAPIIPGMKGLGDGLSGTQVPNLFRGREQGITRQRMLDQGGGNAKSEAMVARGLQFLANHQAPDGHWGMHDFDRYARKTVTKDGKQTTVFEHDKSMPGTGRQNDVAGTAFGLLPFLAAGHTQNPVPGSKFDYSKNVDSALKWLMKRQDKNGYFGGDMYAHGLATIAMCEAYGLSRDKRLEASAQAAIHYIEFAQGPGGGWRYGPHANPGDTSVTGWQLMALKSGQMAGLTVKPNTLKMCEKYLDSCEGSNKGGYSYTPGGGETPTMTAVGLLCRQYLGVNPRNPDLLAGVQRLEKLPASEPRGRNIYYLYYATQVMHHMGGDNWDSWNKGPKYDPKTDVGNGIRDILIDLMDKGTSNPDTEGSWVLPGAEGRLMSTSLALLTLEVYYRHLPLYRREVGQVKGAK
jgi:hypothetical protein